MVGGAAAARNWERTLGLAARRAGVEKPCRVLSLLPASMSLLSSLRQSAARAGLNLFGVVDARRFDPCEPRERRCASQWPECGTVVVLGTGGRGFWHHNVAHGIAGTRAAEVGDELGVAAAHRVADALAAHSLPCRVVAPTCGTLNFLRLGEAAGFGTVSPVSGMLLHPKFGPWLRVRAALLIDGYPFGPIADASITERFQPCCTCAKPCVTACPSGVHDGQGGTDRARCAGHRHAGGCVDGCSSRRACPIGAEHGDPLDAPLHAHCAGLPTVRRAFGLGVWRMVPRFLRGGPPA